MDPNATITEMADFDWVRARAACSLEVAFRQLQTAAKRDVNSMNTVLREARRPVICELAVTGNRFLVTISGNTFPIRSAEFTLTSSGISVEVDKPKARTFSAVPTLTSEGNCKLIVNDQELEYWQVCRMALEDLFFS